MLKCGWRHVKDTMLNETGQILPDSTYTGP